jgi:hypothetical protein
MVIQRLRTWEGIKNIKKRKIGALLYFFAHQKWSKLGTLLQTDANEAGMKKKINKNFFHGHSHRIKF